MLFWSGTTTGVNSLKQGKYHAQNKTVKTQSHKQALKAGGQAMVLSLTDCPLKQEHLAARGFIHTTVMTKMKPTVMFGRQY